MQARQADVLIALAGAATAHTDAAEIWRKNVDDRRRGMLKFATDLAATGEIRPDLDHAEVVDVLWLAMDVRYDWLVRQRGGAGWDSSAAIATSRRRSQAAHTDCCPGGDVAATVIVKT